MSLATDVAALNTDAVALQAAADAYEAAAGTLVTNLSAVAALAVTLAAAAAAYATAAGLVTTDTTAAVDPTPASIVVVYPATTLPVGTLGSPSIVITNAAGVVLPSATANFSSGTPAVLTAATVGGQVAAIAVGSATVTASVVGFSGVNTTVSFTVIAAPTPPVADTTPASLSVVYAATALVAGSGAQAAPTVQVKNAAGTVLPGVAVGFTSGTPGTATVNASTGALTPVAAGSTNILATVSTNTAITATIAITVTAAPANTTPASIVVTYPVASVVVGGISAPTVTVKNSAGAVLAGVGVTYSVTPASGGVVTLATNGQVTGVSVGSATVTAAVTANTAIKDTAPIAVTAPAPPPPVVTGGLVLGAHVDVRDGTPIATKITDCQGLHVKSVRSPCPMYDISSGPGVFNDGYMDPFVNGFHGAGIDVILQLGMWASYATGSTANNQGFLPTLGSGAYTTAKADILAFCVHVFNRYHTIVKKWELGNEINQSFFNVVNAAQYADLFGTIYCTLMAIDSTCTFYMGGFCGLHQKDGNGDPSGATFLQSVYTALNDATLKAALQVIYPSFSGKFTGVSIHPYQKTLGAPTWTVNASQDAFGDIATIRGIMTANGDTGPIAITEFGYDNAGISDTTIAGYYPQAVALLQKNPSAGVVVFEWFLYKETSSFAQSGLISTTGTVTPIGSALLTAAKALGQ